MHFDRSQFSSPSLPVVRAPPLLAMMFEVGVF